MSGKLRPLLMDALADGRRYSGEDLAEKLGCSRTAIWKQIAALRAMGLPVSGERGRGYRLAHAIELLDREKMAALLPQPVLDAVDHFELYDVTDSTSERLRELPPPEPGKMHVALAEYQSSGRGRRGRDWHSPYASGLCMSLCWTYAQAPPCLAALSLAAGVAVVRALQTWEPRDIGLKWPNDILADGGKLAGLLLDVEGEMSGPLKIVIGVGVNVHVPDELCDRVVAEQGLQPVGLNSIARRAPVSRNELAAGAVAALHDTLRDYADAGFASVADDWRAHDVLRDRSVSVRQGARLIEGIAAGVAADGSLQLRVGGEMQSLVSGDVTVRPA